MIPEVDRRMRIPRSSTLTENECFRHGMEDSTTSRASGVFAMSLLYFLTPAQPMNSLVALLVMNPRRPVESAHTLVNYRDRRNFTDICVRTYSLVEEGFESSSRIRACRLSRKAYISLISELPVPSKQDTDYI
jgi:hypothetical protein